MPRLQFPKQAVVERLTDTGWVPIALPDDVSGSEQFKWPDHHAATYALVRHVHRQFDLVLRKKLAIEEVLPPDSYRVVEIEEH